MADDEDNTGNVTDHPDKNKQPKDPLQAVFGQLKEEKKKAKQQELKAAYATLVAADEAKAVAAKKCMQIIDDIKELDKAKPLL